MQKDTHNFTLDIKGLPLTEEQRATISKALNDTLMHQIGGMDFRGKAASAEAQATMGSSFGFIIGIDGSRWEYILRNSDFMRNALQHNLVDKSLEVGTKNFAGLQIANVHG